MADHRAIQILTAIVGSIGTDTDAAENVFRNPGRQLPDVYKAVTVSYGEDAEPSFSVAFADSWLTVYVDLEVKESQPLIRTSAALPDYEASLLNLRKQVHVKLMADIRQGLDFVLDTQSAGAGEIDYGPEGEHVIAKMRTVWRIKYRTSINDPSQ